MEWFYVVTTWLGLAQQALTSAASKKLNKLRRDYSAQLNRINSELAKDQELKAKIQNALNQNRVTEAQTLLKMSPFGNAYKKLERDIQDRYRKLKQADRDVDSNITKRQRESQIYSDLQASADKKVSTAGSGVGTWAGDIDFLVDSSKVDDALSSAEKEAQDPNLFYTT